MDGEQAAWNLLLSVQLLKIGAKFRQLFVNHHLTSYQKYHDYSLLVAFMQWLLIEIRKLTDTQMNGHTNERAMKNTKTPLWALILLLWATDVTIQSYRDHQARGGAQSLLWQQANTQKLALLIQLISFIMKDCHIWLIVAYCNPIRFCVTYAQDSGRPIYQVQKRLTLVCKLHTTLSYLQIAHTNKKINK